MASWSVQPFFAQMTAECPCTLQWDAPSLPLKLPLPWGCAPHLTHWIRPTLNPNSISIGLAVFSGLTSMTDRPTDHATLLVTVGLIYVHSTAMRPNNKSICIVPFDSKMQRCGLNCCSRVNGQWVSKFLNSCWFLPFQCESGRRFWKLNWNDNVEKPTE